MNEVIQKTFWQTSLAFQGPGLPVSNACDDNPLSSSHSAAYHPARKGLALPDTLPTSFTHPTALTSYTLHAIVQISEFPSTRSVLHTFTEIDILPRVGDGFGKFPLNSKEVVSQAVLHEEWENEVLEINVSSTNGWAVEGSRARLGLRVRNETRLPTLSPTLEIVQRVTVQQINGQRVDLDTVLLELVYSDGYVTSPFSESGYYVDFTLPTGTRSIARADGSSLRAETFIRIGVRSVTTEAFKAVVVLPIHVFHPASLSADLWLEHHSLQTELRGAASPTPPIPVAQKRWSAPLQSLVTALTSSTSPRSPDNRIFAERMSTLGHRPKLQHQRHSISGLPTRADPHPFSAYRTPYHPLPVPPWINYVYPQPDWSLYAVSEDESRASRTSRHLRETSKNRGRSVSPPLAPMLQSEVSPPIAKAEQTYTLSPSPRRATPLHGPRAPSAPRLNIIPATILSPISQEILSPKPIIFTNPDSYFDGQQATTSSESSPTKGGTYRCSKDTVKSLEAMVVDDESIVVNEAGEIPRRRSTRRGSNHRRSILNLFEEENKSSEDGSLEGGLYRAREHRICDHHSASLGSVAETPDTRPESQKISTAGSNSIGALDDKDNAIESATESKATFNKSTDPFISPDPSKSARGGRGGRVTSARQLIEDQSNQSKYNTGISLADRKKRYSLPPELLLTSSRKASTGSVPVGSPKEGVSAGPDGVYLQGRRSQTSGGTPGAGTGAAVGKLRGLIERYESVTSATAK
ncbi:hypothetical protein L486_05520 [Kwoniella mangroviensis CBS 10435]|uniref:Uncharacterized protein n=1 Tax=Kwoniella mangroviensis CBS 10435 TaxID=1331196 RepID=A0A1B9IM35_9TREE|nr:hypothetical protein L486_05520 [Kwoniella mangroviensis CBS 10435]